MRKLQQEQNWQHERHSRVLVVILILLVVILSAGRVFMANRLVEASENLRRLDLAKQQLEKENQLSAEQIRKQESSAYVGQKAAELGLTVVKRFAYLAPRLDVALRL